MKKKGFTLIELLAVIVILAIIALIATPLVLKYIEYSKEKSAKIGANTYAEAVEKEYVSKLTKNEKIPNGTYSIPQLENFGVKVKGDKPEGEGDTVTLENGNVTAYVLTINGYIIKYENGNTTVDSGNDGTSNNDVSLDHTVKFVADEKVYEVISVKSGNPINNPLVDPISETGIFAGWRMVGEDEYVSFPYTPTENCEIHAVFKKVRDELEIHNADDKISSSMGTKTNDGMAIYGIGSEHHSFSGTWYTGYLISKDENAVLTSVVTSVSTVTYNEQTWYYSTYRTTNAKSTYIDGIVNPYDAGSITGSAAVTAILDYYFYQT